MITCVAILNKNTESVFFLPKPNRHYNLFKVIKKTGYDIQINSCEQGFLTDDGKFVDRKTAKKIAIESGQILKGSHDLEELFSEDLW